MSDPSTHPEGSKPSPNHDDSSSYETVHSTDHTSPPEDANLTPATASDKIANLEAKLQAKLDETLASKMVDIDNTLTRILTAINLRAVNPPNDTVNTKQFPPSLASLSKLSLEEATRIQANMENKYMSAQARMNVQDDFIEYNEASINTIRTDVHKVGIPTTDPIARPHASRTKSEQPPSDSKTPDKKDLFEDTISPIATANSTPAARDLNPILNNDPPPTNMTSNPTPTNLSETETT